MPTLTPGAWSSEVNCVTLTPRFRPLKLAPPDRIVAILALVVPIWQRADGTLPSIRVGQALLLGFPRGTANGVHGRMATLPYPV